MARKSVSKERKIQIMNSLYKCLLKSQFHEITIKDIAREAGLNHGMIYYFYKNKEDVLLNFIDYITDSYESEFTKYIESDKARALRGKALLRHTLDFSNGRITLNRELSKIFIEIWGIANHNTRVRKKLRYLYNRWISIIKEVLVQCKVPDDWAEGISRATVSFSEGNALFSVIFDWKGKQVKIVLDEFQNRVLEMIDE